MNLKTMSIIFLARKQKTTEVEENKAQTIVQETGFVSVKDKIAFFENMPNRELKFTCTMFKNTKNDRYDDKTCRLFVMGHRTWESRSSISSQGSLQSQSE